MDAPKIEFTNGFSEVDHFEMPLKGWRDDVVVHCPSGKKYRLSFYDSVRMTQTVTDEGFVCEANLIIVNELTYKNIEKVVNNMWQQNLFDNLVAL